MADSKRRKSKKKARYSIGGFNTEITRCEKCQRADLDGTIVLVPKKGVTGGIKHFGSECATWPLGATDGAKVKQEAKRIQRKLERAERYAAYDMPQYSRVSVIRERKPEKGVDVEALGLAHRAGVQNIMAVYNAATPEEKDYWGNWYHEAKNDVKHLAEDYGLDFKVAAAVAANLSPGSMWWQNITTAGLVIDAFKAGIPPYDVSVPGYPENVNKAYRCLRERKPIVSGPKVTAFYESLVDPKAIEKKVVLDSHALNIWFGHKRGTIKTAPSVAEGSPLRKMIEADYAEAADRLGVPPQAVQATTWYVWKYRNFGDVKLKKNDPAKVKAALKAAA